MPGFRRPTLSQRFFGMAVAVVLVTMTLLAGWTGNYVARAVVRGVGDTAAASIEGLISRQLDSAIVDGVLSPERLDSLEDAFSIGSAHDVTRLLQINIRGLDQRVLYQLSSGLQDASDRVDLERAIQGHVVVKLLDLPLAALPGLPQASVPVLKIYTPLRAGDPEHIVGAAELYFSSRSVSELQGRARKDVWVIAALIGFFSLGLVAAMVDGTGRIIGAQRIRLAHNLRRIRELLKRNVALQQASDRLRIESNLAGERMLATVGQDIHDGPVQLLTLLILRMGGRSSQESQQDNVALAQQALEEMRAASSGLALPELTTASLADAIEAAVSRHESLTGAHVLRTIAIEPGASAPLTARICAYRVVQEGLSNAYRHGDGSPPRIMASTAAGRLRIQILNQLGKSSLEPTPGGMGLTGMRFRVESQGGDLDIGFEGGLARVTATIPLVEQPQVSPSAGL